MQKHVALPNSVHSSLLWRRAWEHAIVTSLSGALSLLSSMIAACEGTCVAVQAMQGLRRPLRLGQVLGATVRQETKACNTNEGGCGAPRPLQACVCSPCLLWYCRTGTVLPEGLLRVEDALN